MPILDAVDMITIRRFQEDDGKPFWEWDAFTGASASYPLCSGHAMTLEAVVQSILTSLEEGSDA